MQRAMLLLFPLVVFAPSCTPPECEEPVYAGGGTDEAWATMVDGEASAAVGDPSAAAIDAPAEGQAYAADGEPPTFSWTSAIALAPFRAPSLAPSFAPRLARAAAVRAERSLAEALADVVIPRAHAHEPPVTDDVYHVKVAIPDVACPVAVLTTEESWTVDDESWQRLVDARGKTLTMTIVSAYLTENRITEGAYLSEPRTFRVE